MVSTKLIRDAVMYKVFDTLAESSVGINNMPEAYIAADIMYTGDSDERTRLAGSITHALEDCINTPSHEISFIDFKDNKEPIITLIDGSSFKLFTNFGKKRSWRASKSMSIERFFDIIRSCKTEDFTGLIQDPIAIISHLLLNHNSPQDAARLTESLVPITNFIILDIDQAENQIYSTAFFYSKCGNVDKKVDLPHKLLELRRQNMTTLRCIYDQNWIFDIRIRKKGSLSQHRIEWFLKDYPVGVVRQTTPISIDMLVPVRIQI